MLLAYVATHLLNHALGLVSLPAAEAGRAVFVAVWRNLAGSAAFYGALLVHFGLALWALFERRTLAMTLTELLRIVLGFTIPFLLAAHFVSTRVTWELYGVEDSYRRVAASIWFGGATLNQLVLISVAWLHGCLGIHFLFRHRAGYQRWLPPLVALATLVPVLAAGGYLAMARELAALRELPVPLAPQQGARLRATMALLADTVLALLVATLVLRWLRNAWARRVGGSVRVAYPGRTVQVPRGWSVLEASRAHGIPHLSLCGGRARCSTCRVYVESTAAPLPPPSEDEQRTLARIGALPAIRLACQLRPEGDLKLQPLLSAGSAHRAFEPLGSAMEREVVVLFADLRRWTGMAEDQLPYDLVYVLDRYFEAVGDAVREAGGIPNQFIGDSVMALFGIDTDLATASRQALAAAARIEQRMEELNATLTHEFGRSLDFGIGIHAGMAAVGTVGYRDTRTLTAVGDAVNTASRLQELTKHYAARLVVSEEVLRQAGREEEAGTRHVIDVRGRRAQLTVRALSSVPRECAGAR